MKALPTAMCCASLLAACDAQDPACDVPHATARVAGANAMTWNGMSMQGVWINGAHWNGVNVQGWSVNGINVQGVAIDGLDGTRLGGPDAADGATVDVEAGRLVARDAEGNVVENVAWTGAVIEALFADGATHEVAIASVEQPAGSAGPMSLELTVEGQNLCGEGVRGLFVAGVWDSTGAHLSAVPGSPDFSLSFSCDTGVIAKCVHWGYAPWDVGEDLHQTCTRMARADYCGDGTSYTKDGTRIDVYDAEGIVAPASDPMMEFEAGWGPDGATCVSRPRYDESVVGLGEILPACWADKPVCDNDLSARRRGAVMFNASTPAHRLLCSAREG